MTTDPDPYCEHDWQLDERPSNEAKPVKLKCAKCGAVKDYASEPPPARKETPGEAFGRFLAQPKAQAQLRQIFNP
jgi:hypothetical protein